ncbi:MAG: hypothetical protein Q8N85_04490 [Candidatus Omnitrophota bacterium]|nr:hypothetical protein [Candidatus Omnitrophota bacterium]
MRRLKKGQSTLEYIIIFVAIVGAILYAAKQVIQPAVQNMLTRASDQAERAVNHINFE